MSEDKSLPWPKVGAVIYNSGYEKGHTGNGIEGYFILEAEARELWKMKQAFDNKEILEQAFHLGGSHFFNEMEKLKERLKMFEEGLIYICSLKIGDSIDWPRLISDTAKLRAALEDRP